MKKKNSTFTVENEIRKYKKPMTTKFKGDKVVTTNGNLPKEGDMALSFSACGLDLQDAKLDDFKGSRIILNIFPSVDTGVCAASVRRFNQEAASLENTKVLCISKDLPFAQGRFCGAEGIENVVMLSVFRDNSFQDAYGLLMIDGPLKGLLARAVVVIDENGKVVYRELVPEITQEPDYEKALASLR